MNNKEITLQTILDVMNSRFEQVDKRLDGIDERLDGIDERLDGIDERFDGIDNRLDNMDIRITRMVADNKEAHEKILEELQKQGNTLTRLETDYGNKIAILFDANQATNDRMDLFRNQQLRFADQLEKFSYRLSSVEKLVLEKK